MAAEVVVAVAVAVLVLVLAYCVYASIALSGQLLVQSVAKSLLTKNPGSSDKIMQYRAVGWPRLAMLARGGQHPWSLPPGAG